MRAVAFFNSSHLYVEIGQNSLRVLDGSDGLELSLERLENGRLSPLCAERLALSLRVFLKKHRWRPRPRAFCAIGARGVSLRRLTLPAAAHEDLHRLLLLQIEREFPLPPEELAWGFCPLEPEPATDHEPAPAQTVLVAALKKDALQDYTDLLVECGLTPVFTLAALARQVLCLHPPPACSLLDIGRTHSELVSFQNGVPSSIRLLPWGGEDITRGIGQQLGVSRAEAEKVKLQAEARPEASAGAGPPIQPVIEAELGALAKLIQAGRTEQKLYLSGETTRLKDLAPRLARALGGSVACEPLAVPAGEGFSAAIFGLKRSCEEGRGAPPLLLQTKKPRETENVTRPAPWKWAALACVLALGSLALRYAEPLFHQKRVARQLAGMESFRRELPRIDRELAFLEYLKTNQPPYLDTLFVIAQAAPPGARLESFAMNRRGDLSVRAGMKDAQQVLAFRSNLIESAFFSTVVVDEQNPTPDRQRIVARISGRSRSWLDRKPLPAVPSAGKEDTTPAPGSRVKRTGPQPPGGGAGPGAGGVPPPGAETRE